MFSGRVELVKLLEYYSLVIEATAPYIFNRNKPFVALDVLIGIISAQ